jgi:hypothetical protein
MVLRTLHKVVLGVGLAGAVLLGTAPASLAGGECCSPCWHCPPPYIHCQLGPPRIKFKCVCPLPVCGPCDLKHFGYYPTCWAPYPYPQDYSCCPPPPFGPGPCLAPGMPMGKLPEPDFTPGSRTPAAMQTPTAVPAVAAAVTPTQVARPSPYSPSTDYPAGR